MFDSTISDNELRDLLRQVVLSGDENDSLTEKMIDMERNAVFATTPLLAVSLVKETAFLSQLKGGVAVKTALKFGLNMKWLFGGLGTLCVATTGLVVYKATEQTPNDPQHNKPALTANTSQNSKDSSAFFIATPSDTFGLTPTPPARENVTEQGPEVLLFAEETIIELPVATDPPVKGKRHARRLARTLKKLERLSDAPLPDAYSELEYLPDLPEFPELPELPELADLPEMPEMPEIPEMPELPEMPDFSMETMEMIDMERMARMDELAAYDVYHEDSMLPATSFSNINKLDVNTDWGDIIITKSPDQQVHIAERSANLGVEENNGLLSVFIQPVTHPETDEKQSKQTRSERKKACNTAQESAPLQISIPDGVEVALKNANGQIHITGISTNKVIVSADFGDVHATDINASLQATASSGDVIVRNITGTLMARSYFGDVEAYQVNGSANIYNSSGNAFAKHITGDLSLQSDFGDIGVTNISGRAIINGNSGNISIDSIVGSQLKVNSNFGNVSLKHITAPSELMVNSGNLNVDETVGDLTVHSQFGEVTIDDVKGNLFVYGNSGNIDLSDLDGNLIVESVFGNVDFNDTKGNVTITANSGSVTGQDVWVKENLSVEVDFGNSNIELDNDANDLRFDVEATMGTASVSKGSLKLKKDEGHIVTEKGAITIKGVARSGSVSFD